MRPRLYADPPVRHRVGKLVKVRLLKKIHVDGGVIPAGEVIARPAYFADALIAAKKARKFDSDSPSDPPSVARAASGDASPSTSKKRRKRRKPKKKPDGDG
jgi:hypothetical protein